MSCTYMYMKKMNVEFWMIGWHDLHIQDQSAWALGNIAGDSGECRSLLQAQGVVAPLVNLLQVRLRITLHPNFILKVINSIFHF